MFTPVLLHVNPADRTDPLRSSGHDRRTASTSPPTGTAPSISVWARRVSFTTYLTACLFTTPAAAGDRPVTDMDPIVTSASAIPTPYPQTAANVTVISRDEIEAQHADQVSDMLQHIEGLHVDATSGRGGVSSLYLRGGDPNFTLILLDGVPLNDPMNQRGGSVDLSTLTPEHIDRIELIRGPLSALYGSDAISGVVNIVSQSGGAAPRVRARAGGGRFGYTREVLQVEGPVWGSTTAALSTSYTRNDEQVALDDFEQVAVGWRIDHRDIDALSARLTGQYTHTSTHTFPEGSGGPRLAWLRKAESRRTDALAVGLQMDYSTNSRWHQSFFVNFFSRVQHTDNPGVLASPIISVIPPTRARASYSRLQTRWQTTFNVTDALKTTLGAQSIAERGRQRGHQQITGMAGLMDRPIHVVQRRHTGAIFGEASASITDRLRMVAGGRLDMTARTHPQYTARMSAKWVVTPGTTVHAGYGEGFKLPSLASLGDPIIGNPLLRPETSHGWDIGIEQTLGQGVGRLRASYFYNRFAGLIDLDPDLIPQRLFRLVNVRSSRTQGVEASAQITPTPRIAFHASMTYLQAYITDTRTALRNRPRWRGTVTMTARPLDDWSIRAQVRLVGTRSDVQIPTFETRVPGYVRVDVASHYQLTPSWRVFTVIDNVTNARYEEFLGFPAPPISFRCGLQFLTPS